MKNLPNKVRIKILMQLAFNNKLSLWKKISETTFKCYQRLHSTFL